MIGPSDPVNMQIPAIPTRPSANRSRNRLAVFPAIPQTENPLLTEMNSRIMIKAIC
ncbi:MAG: hypothetical protein AB7S77_10485 [Desulfatirhabdiaceae bacterium]